ncbi:MAG: hypothetical protein PHV34_24515 [Verrucomicrobiae bacterium]|nr:hypothetical protein [Verrucomicrobiae bacterium]
MNEIAEIKSGIGKFILGSTRQPAQVGLVLSPASRHTAFFHEIPVDNCKGLLTVSKLLDDLYVPYEYLSDEMVAGGELIRRKYRAVFLPGVLALSREGKKAVCDYVKNGGVVIADIAPGVYTQDGAWDDQNIFDELFGIKRDDVVKFELMPGGIPQILPGVFVDTSIKNKEGIRCLVKNDYGKGKAFLFNFTIGSYSNLSVAMGSGLRYLFENLIKNVRVERAVFARGEEDVSRQVEISVFQRDKIRMVMAVQNPEASWEAQKVTFCLDKKYFVTNVRTGEKLGTTDNIPIVCLPGLAHVFSLMPYEVKRIDLRAPEVVEQGAEARVSVQIHGTEKNISDHVLHATVTAPDGGNAGFFTINLWAPSGRGEFCLPLALNAARGGYTLEVRDVASCCVAKACFKVR